MSVANLVQPGVRRRPSGKALVLIAVLAAAAVAVPLLAHRGRHSHPHHAAPAQLASSPTRCRAPMPAAPPTVAADPCPAALAAWAAARNLPDVPSGTTAVVRVRLRNQAIEACRAPHQP